MRILLQFPEGLKQYAMKYAKNLEKNKSNMVFISCSPTYGACDIAIDEAKAINADKIIHFGHSKFNPKNNDLKFNIEYKEYAIKANLGILKDSLQYLKNYKKIGIVTTLQHINQLKDIKKFYEKNNKIIYIGKPFGFAKYNGQILGCDNGSAVNVDKNSDAIIYFGGGMFHAIGALLETKKPFVSIDPFLNKIEILDKYREIHKKQSKGKILQSLNAKTFGILVSTKNGQFKLKLAKIIKKQIEKNKMLKAQILITNNFDFDSLNNMLEFDAFVNTACPRLGEDQERLRKPIINVNELFELIHMKAQMKK